MNKKVVDEKVIDSKIIENAIEKALEKILDKKLDERLAQKKVASKKIDENAVKKMERMRDKDREMVRGVFHFHEVPGGVLPFVFRKWKGDPLDSYQLADGEVYTLPLRVAKHLNSNCWYPVHTHELDEKGKASTRVGKKVRRCSFQSLEFSDDLELNNSVNSLVTVEKV